MKGTLSDEMASSFLQEKLDAFRKERHGDVVGLEKFNKLHQLADAMYYAAQSLTTDASRLHKAMEDYRQFVINELKEK